MRSIAYMLLACASSWAQPQTVYPGRHWETENPAKLGWSVSKLEAAREFLATLPPASVLVVDRGRLVAQWGDPGKRVKISSVRKSFLSALYGIYAHEGRIRLDKKIADLGIDDEPPLTELEKHATARKQLSY